MRNLAPYENAFDRMYPGYATERYEGIRALAERLSENGVLGQIDSVEFRRAVALIEPFTRIRNYKSQVPFPVDIAGVLRCMIELKRCPIPVNPLSGKPTEIFLTLIEKEGFQLPTVSAVFHFCHPDKYPIVDRKVEGACAFLKKHCPEDFDDLDAPRLPAARSSSQNKLSKYLLLIEFIKKIEILQGEKYGGDPNYRFIDKALMVLGDEDFRRRVDESISLAT